MYYQKLYTPRISPAYNHSWTNFIEQEIAMYGKNKQHEKEFYNREISMQKVKKATKTLKNDKSTGPELIKNKIYKIWGQQTSGKTDSFFQ